MKGIGIDTGGTCTDAVIYDFETGAVAASAKTLTTHHDLKIGITEVLHMLPQDLLAECGQAALSTTLATNACVENLGGRGKIIFFGISRKVFNQTWRSYGFRSLDDILLVDCHIVSDPAASEEPDWEAFRKKLPAFLADCDCVSVVQLYAADHGGAYELHAREIIHSFPEFAHMPVILGNTLFADRNAIRRGAGALLNARLVPVVCAFMEAIREVFSSLQLDIPITIIRSDGSQMSEAFAAERPVETLLCGPAASVIGACTLSNAPNALVVDMGGTTTDIAIVKNRIVKRAQDGIQVGDWKTFVKGLYVDTFGLGGDTRIYYDRGGRIRLAKTRVQPLCTLAAEYPQVLEDLRALDASGRLNVVPLHEHFLLLRDIESEDPDHTRFYNSEHALCQALKNGPLSYEKAAAAMEKDIYTADFSRLESARVILRCGLTPTDFMHLRGDFDAYCGEASRLAASFFVRSSEAESVDSLTDTAYDLVTERLYKNIVRILLTTECDPLAKAPFDGQMEALIDYAWQLARNTHRDVNSGRREDIALGSGGSIDNRSDTALNSGGSIDSRSRQDSRSLRKSSRSPSRSLHSFLPRIFETRAKLVGVGAPTHIFLPRVAKMLRTQALLPDHAAVANAVGAITGRVIAIAEVEVRPVTGDDYGDALVVAQDTRQVFSSRAKALSFARKEGRRIVREKALAQGAADDGLEIREERMRNEAPMGYGMIWLGDTLRFTASGKLRDRTS